jgi:hypothetical protein
LAQVVQSVPRHHHHRDERVHDPLNGHAG